MEAEVATPSFAVPGGAGFGEKSQKTPSGKPPHDRFTVPGKPTEAVIVIV
jgi:hypothetical protein